MELSVSPLLCTQGEITKHSVPQEALQALGCVLCRVVVTTVVERIFVGT